FRFPLPSSRFHRMSPDVFTQTRSRALSSVSGVVRKTRSFQTIGVEPARFGNSSFQARFSVLLNLTGAHVSRQMPSYRGPRQAGQLSACAVALETATSTTTRLAVRKVDDIR